MTHDELDFLLSRLPEARVCVIGDICLDMYLYADMTKSVLSRETPHHPLPVVRETVTPGGGGNVMNNVHALGAQLHPISVIGNDWRGFLLRRCFEENGIPADDLIRSDAFITPAYLKPMRMGISDVVYEDPRLDFENRVSLSEKDETALIDRLKKAAAQCDVVAVADQMDHGVITGRVREVLAEIARVKPVIADSRSRLTEYCGNGIILKPNEVEAAAALGKSIDKNADFIEAYSHIGAELSVKNKAPVVMTLGDKGAMWCENGQTKLIPTVKAKPPIDIVGCGDAFLSALASCLALGMSGETAIAMGNLASAVTVKKIGMTGTATPDEIRAKFEELTQ